MSKRILVYGAGGFAREVKDVLDAMEEAGKAVRCDRIPGRRGEEPRAYIE